MITTIPYSVVNHSLGYQVSRATDAFVITVSPGDPYFTVAGGVVLITALVGYITVTPGGAANTISFELNPDEATGADVVLCTPTDIGTTGVVGDLITITGDPADALICGHRGTNPTFDQGPIVCSPGVIGCVITAAVGSARWDLWYIPVTNGATVTAIP